MSNVLFGFLWLQLLSFEQDGLVDGVLPSLAQLEADLVDERIVQAKILIIWQRAWN